MTRHKVTTEAEYQARTAALIKELEAGVAAIQTGEDFKRYLEVAAKFHTYSHNNVLLILGQCPHATRVAGYKTWQSLGRQVKKGEKAIYIFAPRPYAIDTKNEDGEEEQKLLLTFRAVPVFDISQTEGTPLPTVEAQPLTGDQGEAVYTRLVAYAERLGLTVTNVDPDTAGDDSKSNYRGYYSPARLLIFVKQAAPAQMLKTLIHELAHYCDPELLQASKSERETVAEATAFVVAAHQGLDTGTYSFPYIAGWAGQQDGPTLIKKVMGRVQAIAHQIIEGIEVDESDPKPPAATQTLPGEDMRLAT